MAFFIAGCVAGDTRVLAATVKLGMGYDKSDIRFVIHFQLPQNLIAYYQQIGRAGRDGKPAYAFLLHGEEDEEILTHFIATTQASPNLLKDIVGMARFDRLLHEARGSRFDAPDAQETCGICANCRGGFIVPVSADQSTVAAATRYLDGRHGGFSVDLYRRCGRAAGSRRFERVSFCASQNGQWGLNEREIHRRAEDSQIDKH